MKHLMIIAAVILISLTSAEQALSEGEKLTRVRMVGSAEGTFVNQGGLLGVRHVQAKFKNVGTVEAKNVRVHATLPGGQQIDLLGPTSLAPNKSALYTNSGFETVTNTNKIRARVSCSNCR